MFFEFVLEEWKIDFLTQSDPMDRDAWTFVHALVTLLWILVALCLALIYAPIEINMGNVYRIFYIHVASAWTAMVGYFLIFLGSVGYLARRSQAADDFAYASGEVGFISCSCIFITGPLWAKPIWGVWWTWDPRLTLTFVLWLLYVAYLLLRKFSEDSNKSALLSAVVGVMGFTDVPIDYMSTRWWRTQHPQPVIMGGPDSGLPLSMALTLLVSCGAFLCLFSFLLRRRLALIRAGREVTRLRRELSAE
jgi:heme exporter protein C